MRVNEEIEKAMVRVNIGKFWFFQAVNIGKNGFLILVPTVGSGGIEYGRIMSMGKYY